jgi:hypothetical protein
MEFFWNDAHDPKFFYVFDTETKTLEAIQNTHTLFKKIYYDDTKTDYSNFDEDVEGKFVKIVVMNKTDLYTFDRLVDTLQNSKIHELKIAENFQEFGGEFVADSDLSLEDTQSLLNSYIDAVDTDLDKDRIKTEMSQLMIEAQTQEIQ